MCYYHILCLSGSAHCKFLCWDEANMATNKGQVKNIEGGWMSLYYNGSHCATTESCHSDLICYSEFLFLTEMLFSFINYLQSLLLSIFFSGC